MNGWKLKSIWSSVVVQLQNARREIKEINLIFAAVLICAGAFLVCEMPPAAQGTTLGAVAALLVAFVAYPWQKTKDRDLKIDEERRAAVGALVTVGVRVRRKVQASSSVFQPELPVLTGEYQDLDAALAMLHIYCEPSIIELARAYRSALKNYVKKLEAEKKRRPPLDEGKKRIKRPAEYQILVTKRQEAYWNLRNIEEKFLAAVSVLSGGEEAKP